MRIVGTIAAALGVAGTVAGLWIVAVLPPYWLSGALVLVAEVALLAVAVYLLWRDVSNWERITVCAASAVVGGAVAWIAIAVAGLTVDAHHVCTADGSDDGLSVGVGVGLLVYAAIGAAGFHRPRWLPLVWPVAGIVGAVVFYWLTRAFPPGHSYCET
jgi:hypothetical protein